MVIRLERSADLHIAQLMLLPLTVSCFSKIRIDFALLVLAHPGSPRQRAVKQVCVCVCVCIVHFMCHDIVALYLGIKMFIIEYLYNRFPRFKQHHDSVYKIWQQLPTDAILEDQYKRSLVDRVCSLTDSNFLECEASVLWLLPVDCFGADVKQVATVLIVNSCIVAATYQITGYSLYV